MSQQPPNQPWQPRQPYQSQQWQSGPPPAPPKKKRSRRFWIIVGIAVLLLFACIGVSQASKGAGSPATNSQAATQPAHASAPPTHAVSPTAPAKPTATPKPTQAPKWTAVQTIKGNGNKKTGTFAAPDDWKIVWSCTPSSFFGGTYNVIISVYNSDGTPADFGAVNATCKAGNTGDFTEEHSGGTVYLDIESEGAWNVQVQVLK